MLVLSRKPNQHILIGDSIKVSVIKIDGNKVRLGIDAPRACNIRREEIVEAGYANAAMPVGSAREAGTPDMLAAVRRRRILIVDDCPEDREICRRLLSQSSLKDCEISESDCAEEGLVRLRAENPDCVILDFGLPDSTGLDFLERLEAEKPDRVIPVIMMTGHGSEEIAVEAMKHGALDYMVKGHLTFDKMNAAVTHAMELAERCNREGGVHPFACAN